MQRQFVLIVLLLLLLEGWAFEDDELTRAVKQFAPNAFEAKSSSGSAKSRSSGNSGKKAPIGESNKQKIANIGRLAPNIVREVFRENARQQNVKVAPNTFQHGMDPRLVRAVFSEIAEKKNPALERRGSQSLLKKVLDKKRPLGEINLPKVVNFKENDLKEFVEELAAQEVQAAQQVGGSPGWSPMEFDLDEMHAILKTMDLVDKGKEKITEEDLLGIPAEQFQQAVAGRQPRERVRHNVHGLLQEVLEEIRQPETWLEREVIDSYLDRITSNREDIAFVPCYVINEFRRERRIAPNWLQTIQNLHQIRMFFVPVHLHGNHWALAIWDRRTDDDAIEVFDSLIMNETLEEKEQFLNALRAFFKEICVQNGQQWENPGFVLLKRVPQQPNGYDCGVYALMFAHYMATEGRLAASKFGPSEVDAFREKIYTELRDIYFPRGSGGRSKSAGASRGRERGASAEQRGHSKSQGKRSRSRSGGKKFSEDSVNDAHMRKRSNSQNLERTSSGRYIPISAKRDDKGDGKTRSKSGSRKDRHGSMSRSGSRSGSRSRSRSRSASGGSHSRSGSRSGSSGTGRRETKARSRHSAQQPSGSQSRGKKPYGKRSQEEQGSQKPTRKSRDSRDRNKSRSDDRSRSRSGSRSSRSSSRSGSWSQGGGAEHRSRSGNRSASRGSRSDSKNNRSGSRSGSSHRSGSRSGDRKQSKKSKARPDTALKRSPPMQLEVIRMPMLSSSMELLPLRSYRNRRWDQRSSNFISQLPQMNDEEFKRVEEYGHIFEGIEHRVERKERGEGAYYICTRRGFCYGRLIVYKNKHFRRTALHSCDEARRAMKKPVHGRVCVIPVLKEKKQKYMVKLNCAAKNDIAMTIWAQYMPEGQCLDYVVDVQYCEGKFHFDVGIGVKKGATFYVPQSEVNVIHILNMEGKKIDVSQLISEEKKAKAEK